MLVKRLVVALLSTVIFSLVLAYMIYTPVSERHSNTWYDPFGAPVPTLLLITGLAYLLGGIPASLLIDKYVEKRIIKLPLYLSSGFIVGIITIISSFKTILLESLWYGIYGLVGSLIFFSIMSLFKIIN
ncbi:hypothetical protein [Gracilibacillus xinjiangensis]|uniref:Major facilitator superfamily (MFS) profile domain-containing protein n=1 Tax=Gracilibacillus xinjiangensis TaxID=1193282 RepID=A0ABV8WX57_9BACI